MLLIVLSVSYQKLLAAVDTQPWIGLAKRRVQHYGYEFCYGTRNVDTKNRLGELPPFVSPVLERISLFPNLDYDPASLKLDQLTVHRQYYNAFRILVNNNNNNHT